VGNFPSASSVGPSLTDVSQVTISIPSSPHAVMVFGDAVVRCSEPGGCFGTLVWQVSGGLTSYDQRTLNVALLDGEELMVSVQQIVLLDSGSQELVLQMSYTGTGGALGLTPYELAAVDLGK
ncbi:MAG TPA: hypothetical protein VHG52_12970, partial [Thermomicrobiales bacterium]|nr:hypothetical protein [Thermomicrobiales bacterium]